MLPFAHLNLTCNPFGALDADEIAALAVPAVDGLAARLRRPRHAVVFTGRRGAGKTTHLHALRAAHADAPYVYFPPDGTPPAVPEAPLLFLDELQRLPTRDRRRLFRRSASFAIASHRDHSPELADAGLTVDVVRLAAPAPERLHAMVARRIEWARRGPGPVPSVSLEAARRLLHRFGGDLRSIEGYLYDIFQQLEEPCAVHQV